MMNLEKVFIISNIKLGENLKDVIKERLNLQKQERKLEYSQSMDKDTTFNDFQILNKLGEGAFGQVFKVKRKIDGQVYAMKKIKLATMKQKQRQNALNQVRILASYNGEFIIGYKQSFYDESSSTLCIVMQFASEGDLLKMCQNHIKNKTRFEEGEIWKAMVHISQGLRSLHEKKILHRDLKCANVFVTGEGVYKLGDLNVSKVLKKDLARTQTGTPYYASPQVWKDKPYGVKSDMWSLGCVLYQMAALRPPFTATDLSGLYKKICLGYFPSIPANYSSQLSKIISLLLKQNPNDRPNTIQLLENPIVHKMYSGQIDVKIRQQQDDDFLLKTLKVNHGHLPSIKNILPKSNYDGQIKTSRVRTNSIQRVKTESKEIQKITQKDKEMPKILRSQSSAELREKKEKEQKLINNYLEMKRKHEEKQRQRLIDQLKNDKDNLIRKRQRVLSACGIRPDNMLLASPRNKLEQKPTIKIANTPSVAKKQPNHLLPPTSNKNLPPKPIQNPSSVISGNNANYKMPPKPIPLVPSRQNNSIDYSRQISRQKAGGQSQRQKSKQNLIRAGQHILIDNSLKSPKMVSNQQKNRIVRSSSAQKVVYPSWWID